MAFRWSEKLVVQAVVEHYYKQPWLVLPKFRPGSGTGQWAEKEFDLFAFHPWTSEGYTRHVVEAKISRSDFLKEAKDPIKKRAGLYCSNKFYFAAPAGCVRDLEEIPTNCGYYKVGGDPVNGLTCERVIAAPELADEPPTWNFLAAAVRRLLTESEIGALRSQIAGLESQIVSAASSKTTAPEAKQEVRERILTLQETIAQLSSSRKGKRR